MVFSRTCPATLNRDLLLLPADILTVLLIKVQLFQSALRRQLTPTSLQSNYPVSGATLSVCPMDSYYPHHSYK